MDINENTLSTTDAVFRAQADANLAYECLIKDAPSEKKSRDRYAALCHDLPALLRRSGLLETIAWLQAKSDGSGDAEQAAARLAKHLAWCLAPAWSPWCDMTTIENQPNRWAAALLDTLRHVSPGDYLMLTRRAFGLAEWFKRYAQSELQGNKS